MACKAGRGDYLAASSPPVRSSQGVGQVVDDGLVAPASVARTRSAGARGYKWCCSRFQIGQLSWPKALGFSLLVWVIYFAIYFVGRPWLFADKDNEKFTVTNGVALLAILFGYFAVPWLLIRWRFGALPRSARTGFLVALSSVAFALFVSLPAAVAFKMWVGDTFAVSAGSMALSLYGAHADVTCQNCGRQFAVSLSDRVADPDLRFLAAPRRRRPPVPIAAFSKA